MISLETGNRTLETQLENEDKNEDDEDYIKRIIEIVCPIS